MPSASRNELIAALPYARRYARALTGNQQAGDALVATALQEASQDEDEAINVRGKFYRHLTRLFKTQDQDGLTLNQRALMLLVFLEGQSFALSTQILNLDTTHAEAIFHDAQDILEKNTHTDVLIIEDEAIIALDIQGLVERCGHRVVGVAHCEADAVRLAEETKPGLILADINLGVGGDGMHAVRRILEAHKAPVIFVTAYPERLLTGESQEPSFVITKPFEPMALSVATYQAVTGGSLVV
ncbi:two-component response regulator [Neokomagataea thailandica NBRC 106555]|uniref:Response regulator n=2 Tax=Neokomagataea TaxID=1223423 RepID=A0A4Y6VAZ0_9PROT|nr:MULTISPECIES: response regulator [Neokomagataea]QDH25686.1 response regulator [Neokomagataea tanensis]GBR55265.1 two-component response regulator [Neokomagataea thailandica NBRC 106555]